MARTIHGNLTGQAARTQRADDRQALLDSIYRDTTRKQEKITNMMTLLKIVEGEAFVNWWDKELPPDLTQDQQITLLVARMATTCKGIDLPRLAAERQAHGWNWSANFLLQWKGG